MFQGNYSGGGRGGGSYQQGPRPTYPATCSDCGKETTVPFQPKEDRPVYCRDCYAKRRPAR